MELFTGVSPFCFTYLKSVNRYPNNDFGDMNCLDADGPVPLPQPQPRSVAVCLNYNKSLDITGIL